MLVVHVEGIFAHTAKLKNNAVVVLKEVEEVSHATPQKQHRFSSIDRLSYDGEGKGEGEG